MNESPTEGYYENPRLDVLRELPGSFEKVLDVGCGAGIFSRELKRSQRARMAHGVELAPAAAAQAEAVLDKVFRVDLSASSEGLPPQAYDLVLCLDVLEHMHDPWAALERIHGLIRDNGLLVVSLPNVRNFRVVLGLLRGRWDYAPSGILDSTHLRFFTRATAAEMLEKAGFGIERIASPSQRPFRPAWWLNLLTLGLFRGFLEYQYIFLARPRNSAAKAP